MQPFTDDKVVQARTAGVVIAAGCVAYSFCASFHPARRGSSGIIQRIGGWKPVIIAGTALATCANINTTFYVADHLLSQMESCDCCPEIHLSF